MKNNNSNVTKITLSSYHVNGWINPLINNFQKLVEVAGGELNEAIRWCLIHLNNSQTSDEYVAGLSITEKAVIFNEFKQLRDGRSKNIVATMANGTKVYSAAQFLCALGGGSGVVKCYNSFDFFKCLELVGSYNSFNVPDVSKILNLNKKKFYSETNPNNGNDLFEYWVGWEYSFVVYIKMREWNGTNKVLTEGNEGYYNYSINDFRRDFEVVGRVTSADEISFTETKENKTTGEVNSIEVRLWWD